MIKKKWTNITLSVLLSIFFIGVLTETGFSADKKLIKIVTTAPGVPWHVLGARLSAELNKRNPNVSASTATGGSVANIIDVSSGVAQAGWTVNPTAVQAVRGIERFKKPVKGFSVIAPFAVTPLQIIVQKKSKIESIHDLQSHRVGIGKANWGSTALTLKVFETLGMSKNSFKKNGGLIVYTGYDSWQVQMQDQSLDAIIYWGGLPSSLTISLINEPGVKFVALKKEEIEKVLKNPDLGSLFSATIPKNFYEPIQEDYNTFQFASLALANDKLADDIVYEMVKIICEPTPDIAEIYKDGLSLSLELVKKWLPINKYLPIHPGARKYFKEKGLL